MVEERVRITNRLGLHARAAAQLVRTANGFQSVLRLERIDGSAVADAKSILSVLMLAAARGTELRATAEGTDEKEAMAAMRRLFADGFGESGQEL
jgi:phosphocarrier protein HPr